MNASAQRRLHHLGVAAAFIAFALSGCRDEPLVIPAKPKPPLALGGEASGGEGSGGEGGSEPSLGGTAGDTSTAGSGATSPLGGNGGSAPAGGMSGMAGKPPINLNCGDDKPNEGEECDDGNELSGDGCSSQCQSSCEACQKNVCPLWTADPTTDDWYTICYNMAGKADSGPAKGVDRKILCHDLVKCVYENQCAQEVGSGSLNFNRCFCDLDFSTTEGTLLCKNPTTFVPGKCARQFQEASEKDTPGEVFAQLTAIGAPLGVAFRLLQDCDSAVCREECQSGYFGEAIVAQITADLPAAPNPAGESPLGLLIADAQRAAGASAFAFVLPLTYTFNDYSSPGLIFDATPDKAADADGRVLESELKAIYLGYRPLDNQNQNLPTSLVTLTMTGQQIYDLLNTQASFTSSLLQVSGLSYTWDNSLPPGSQIVEVRKDGSAIDKAQPFTVTVDDVLGGRGPFATAAKTMVAKSPTDLLAEHIKSLPQPIAPPTPGRIVRLN